MTAQEYIQSKLEELKQPLNLLKANDDETVEAIYKLLMSKKFRKYSASSELQEHIKSCITISLKNQQPINLVFTQGAYKLWRLDESPGADWAELFIGIYYINWLRPICEIYQPGVWLDFFVDDLILPRLNDVDMVESNAYRQSFQGVLNYLKNYQPSNLKMTITGVGEQFASADAFYEKLDKDTKKYADKLKDDLPELTGENVAMITLNAKPNSTKHKDPRWMQKNKLIHDAYLTFTKAETGYHNRPDKIKVFSQPLPSGMFLAPGTTKDSIAKHWAGVGILKPKEESYRQIILSPKQLADAQFEFQAVNIEGLEGKNFHKIRVLK